jgi:hypothetical protein
MSLQGKSITEISKETGWSEKTVERDRTAKRKYIRAMLDKGFYKSMIIERFIEEFELRMSELWTKYYACQQAHLLKQMRDEHDVFIEKCLKLGLVEGPVERTENEGHVWMGNVLQHIKENLEKQGYVIEKS